MLDLAKIGAWGAMGYWAALHAAYKGYPRILSLLLCIPFGPLSFVVVYFLQPVAEGRERVAEDQQIAKDQAESQESSACPNCGRENSVTARICPRCEQRLQ
jgi:uncharacterized paraquat-inducible protein A